MADWAGVSRAAIDAAIKRDPNFPEPVDHLGMGNLYKFSVVQPALERLGFQEGGGSRLELRKKAKERDRGGDE
jgi:hypothetical protein